MKEQPAQRDMCAYGLYEGDGHGWCRREGCGDAESRKNLVLGVRCKAGELGNDGTRDECPRRHGRWDNK